MDLPQDIKKKIALKVEAVPLGEEGVIYNWAQKMYQEVFGKHHLQDFPELKDARARDKRMRDDS